MQLDAMKKSPDYVHIFVLYSVLLFLILYQAVIWYYSGKKVPLSGKDHSALCHRVLADKSPLNSKSQTRFVKAIGKNISVSATVGRRIDKRINISEVVFVGETIGMKNKSINSKSEKTRTKYLATGKSVDIIDTQLAVTGGINTKNMNLTENMKNIVNGTELVMVNKSVESNFKEIEIGNIVNGTELVMVNKNVESNFKEIEIGNIVNGTELVMVNKNVESNFKEM